MKEGETLVGTPLMVIHDHLTLGQGARRGEEAGSLKQWVRIQKMRGAVA